MATYYRTLISILKDDVRDWDSAITEGCGYNDTASKGKQVLLETAKRVANIEARCSNGEHAILVY